MMISSAGASSPYAAAAAVSGPSSNSWLERVERLSSDSSVVASGPDGLVVTLGQGSPAASTYDASGKMSGAPTLDDLGANAQDSSTKAAESDGADSADPTSAPSATSASGSLADSSSNANVDEDAAVAA